MPGFAALAAPVPTYRRVEQSHSKTVPPRYHPAIPTSLVQSAQQSSVVAQTRANKPNQTSHTAPWTAPGPSDLCRTTLSQRFRRAIQQGDLAAAQRIAARAFELQSLPGDLVEQSSPRPPKAALRAAQAQRPSSAHPFDIRNVEPIPERVGLSRHHHHHHRKYTLAIHDESVADYAINSDPSLLIAIRSNADVELIRWLIEMGHEHKAPSLDADGNTVLHLATLYDRSDIIYAYSTYTTSHVASTLADLINAETLHDRRTALHLACIRGYDDVARQLLDLGADVDLQDRAGNTALHFASAWGHLSLVQLLIERGCSLAVKNAEDSTATDYAYSNSVKEALETLGRVRFESRKKTRRVPVATVMPAGIRPSASTNAASPLVADESMASDKQSRSRPFPSFLSRNGSNSGAHRSSTTSTPVRAIFPDTSADPTAELYDDWDPEKTFAQPGQDLFPGNRGAFSSPPVQRVASPANFSTSSRASIDLYTEVLNQSPRSTSNAALGAAPSISSYDYTASPQTTGASVHSPHTMLPPSGSTRSPHEPTKGLLPHTASGAEIKRSLSPNFPPSIRRTPSPGNVGASADKLRMQDAAAMSLFRSTTPQPSHVPGRIGTPPIPYNIRSESPLLMINRAGRSGVKSPPPLEASGRRSASGGSTMTSEGGGGTDRSTGGPPLLAPVATLPTFPRDDLLDDDGESIRVSGVEGLSGMMDARPSRGGYDGAQKTAFQADTRRDSSPSTPRPPDDRETF